MTPPESAKKVPCPRCGAPASFDPQNKWRPFCSERCKMIDLGDWAAEKFRVPAEEKGSEQISQNPPDPADKQ